MGRSTRSSDWRRFVVGFAVASVMSIAPVHTQEMCGRETHPFPYTMFQAQGPPFAPASCKPTSLA